MNMLLIIALITLSITVILFIIALFKMQDMLLQLKTEMDVYRDGFKKMIEAETKNIETFNQMKSLLEMISRQYEEIDKGYSEIAKIHTKVIDNYSQIIEIWKDVDTKYSDTFEQFKNVREGLRNMELSIRKDIDTATEELKKFIDETEFDVTVHVVDEDEEENPEAAEEAVRKGEIDEKAENQMEKVERMA